MDTDQGESTAVRGLGLIAAAALHSVTATAFVSPVWLVASRRSTWDRAVDTASGCISADMDRSLAFAKEAIWDRRHHATRDAIQAQVAAGAAP